MVLAGRFELWNLWRRARIVLIIVFGLSLLGAYILDIKRPANPAFVIEMSSDASGVAQLFYDIGRGMNEADSVWRKVNAEAGYAALRFPLPRATIHAVRFDPLYGPGRFVIRRAYFVDPSGAVTRQLAPRDLMAVNQIVSRVESGSEVRFSTQTNATDPILLIALHGPLNLGRTPWEQAAHVAAQLGLCLLVTALVGAGYLVVQPRLGAVAQRLDGVAQSLSDPRFLVVDRLAVCCYLGILAFFSISLAAGFHGSGISQYSHDDSVRPIIGRGKAIRSDEWAYHTPAILHQLYRETPFEAQVSQLGPDFTALIANVPVRHFTTALRPQFWGFFFLPPSFAFAFYWQFKAMLLLTGVFSLLLLLTRSSRLAAFGALWYAFSPFIQWTYSWASLLPEMIGWFCIVMFAVFYMTVGRRPVLLATAALTCVMGAVNFALSAYIPHQIPLVWLGLVLVSWWILARRTTIFSRDAAGLRLSVLCGAWLVVGVVMLFFYRDAEAAVRGIANTVYPGRRSMPGGTYPIVMLGSHFFSFWADDRRFPLPQWGSICDNAGFFWLAPITLFGWRSLKEGERDKKLAYLLLALFGVLLFVWLTLPVPQWVGVATLMDKSGVRRSLHVLGLVNIALVTLYLSVGTRGGERKRLSDSLVLGVAVFASVYPMFRMVNSRRRELPYGATGHGWPPAMSPRPGRGDGGETLPIAGGEFLLPQIAVFGFVNPPRPRLDSRRVIRAIPLHTCPPGDTTPSMDRVLILDPGSIGHLGLFFGSRGRCDNRPEFCRT